MACQLYLDGGIRCAELGSLYLASLNEWFEVVTPAPFELVRLATAYEADLDRQLRMLVSVAEPLLLFAIAGMIGTLVIGMLLPIFNLQDIVK